MFTIKKLIVVLSIVILLSIGNVHSLNKVHAATTTIIPSSTQTVQVQTKENVQQDVDGQLERITKELQDTSNSLEKANLDITSTKSQMEQLTIEISYLTERIEDREKVLKERLVSYKQGGGNGSYLEILLNANNYNKFMESPETVDMEQTILKQQETEKNDLKNKKEMFNKKLTELALLQTDIEQLQTKLPIQQKQLDLLKKQQEKNLQVEKEMKENTYIKIVTNVGNKYIGKSVYVFGGGRNDLDIAKGRFDCSGFVHWAFAQAGIKIGNSTDSIKNSGKRVSVEDMKPGDLVFFDTYKKDGHVGIYLGNGKFIGSQCSTGVAIADMTKGYWKNVFKGHVERIQKNA